MDFLSFKEFISIPALIVFYYLGAVVMPVFIWLLILWLIHKYPLFDNIQQAGKARLWSILTTKQKLLLAIVFILSFLMMELFWRMMFEFLIAYIQIRNALVS